MIVRTRPRAFIAAFMPMILANVVNVGGARWRAIPSSDFWMSTTVDTVLILFFARIVPDIIVFVLLHLIMVRCNINGRHAYAGAGALAALSGYGLSQALGYPFDTPNPGAILAATLPVIGIGALCGFLYPSIAGYADDSSKTLRPARAVQTSDVPYAIEGPLRVRFSLGATIAAAFVPPLVTGLLSLFVEGSILSAELISSRFGEAPPLTNPWGWGRSYVAQNVGAVMLVSYVTVIASFTAVPIMVLNICALGIARLRKSINYGAFAVAGAIVGAIVTVPISVAFNMVAFLPLTIVYPMAMGALSAIVYRSLAGLEPVPLPEHVLVDHDSSLAPPDDPSRRMHRVLFQK